MKRLILIKQSPAIQLAHLYEHIFCCHVETFFYQNQLFPYVDYFLAARTLDAGVIYIDLYLYTPAAIALAHRIPGLDIELNQATISIATRQLMAEKEEPLGSSGYDIVLAALAALQAQSWQNIDDVDTIDAKNMRRRAKPFYLAVGRPIRSRRLSTAVLLDPAFAAEHRELLPLFRQLAWVITASFQADLPDNYGYYSFDDHFRHNRQTTGLFNIFKVARTYGQEVDLAANLVTCLESIADLRRLGGFGRFLAELRQTSYRDRTDYAPDPIINYQDSLIFMGSTGWWTIATSANFDLIMSHVSIELKYGRHKLSQTVDSDSSH